MDVLVTFQGRWPLIKKMRSKRMGTSISLSPFHAVRSLDLNFSHIEVFIDKMYCYKLFLI